MFTNYNNASMSTVNPINHITPSAFINRLLSIALMMFVFGLTNLTFAQSRANRDVPTRRVSADENEYKVLVNPLSPDDPRAQLDPALVGVAAIPRPIYGAAGAENEADANATVEFDLKTGKMNNRRWNPIETPKFVESLLDAGNARLPGSRGANLQQDNADAQPRGQRSESVIGGDERRKVTNTAAYPWRAIVKLYPKFPNGLTYNCSGTLVDAKYVLTAGHCIYSAKDGGWATSVQVIPGLNGTYQPYGAT